MSAAAAEAAPAAPKGGGKKKLIIILAAVLVLVLGGGGAAFFMMKKKAAAEAEAEGGEAPAAAAHAAADVKHGAPPVFVPLDPFTVNLADREAERYAQVGITFEIDDSHTADTLKAYMPAIRNNILLLLSHKTAAEMLSLEGKQKLAKEIRRESLTPLGVIVEDEDDEEADAAADHDTKKPKKKKRRRAPPVYPIKAVHFSNLIVQ